MRSFISRIFGVIAAVKFPKFIQNFINRKYVEFFKIDMSEFDLPQSYASLNALFTRRLLRPREIAADETAFISPSDGVIFESGCCADLQAFSVKGCEYSLSELLGCTFTASESGGSVKNLDDAADAAQAKIMDGESGANYSASGVRAEIYSDESGASRETSAIGVQGDVNLSYANIYLSPRDYHHYHAPCDLSVLQALYIPADLYSVAKKFLLKIPNLYAKNERVILKCKMRNGGILWMVFVGALNVGKMRFDFDARIQTNACASRSEALYEYENLNFKKGDHLGNFELGSTIVLVAQSEFLKFETPTDTSVKFGQKIAEFNEISQNSI
ncbi:MAG: phosphatidylserine decarboxylase [Campylobacter gracilis]|uniref:archaetidylserine decarboxylase n=1 Tax=Campylobacter gracilis TaxID=824 RepID=UPI0026EFB88D|nr:archaetidylserine decarboxylase [Campylobacter gracilis]MBS6151968.1 phosphatidylserine decarboxylase [Campylobacter gracilis]